MKNPDRESVSRLSDLPNIGKTIASYLKLIGIDHPKKLIGKDPLELYKALSNKKDLNPDPCLIDVFISVVRFMEGADPLPWWSYTAERKKHPSQHKGKYTTLS